jgi:hypothetical protein
MEPISEVLGTLVAELIDTETVATDRDRAMGYEEAAMQTSLSGLEYKFAFTSGE